MPYRETVIKSFASPDATTTRGIHRIGKYLYVCGDTSDLIYQLDLDGNVIQSFASPGTNPIALDDDGKYLLHIAFGTDLCYFLDENGTTIKSFPVVAGVPSGVASDGKNILVAHADDSIYFYTNTGTLIKSFSLSAFTSNLRDISFDGKNIWICDPGSVLDVGVVTLNGVMLKTFTGLPDQGIEGVAVDGRYKWLVANGTQIIQQTY